MGATVKYEILKSNPGKSLPVDLPSRFREIFSARFGEPPFVIEPGDRELIFGMKLGSMGQNKEAFDRILELLEKDLQLKIWFEY